MISEKRVERARRVECLKLLWVDGEERALQGLTKRKKRGRLRQYT